MSSPNRPQRGSILRADGAGWWASDFFLVRTLKKLTLLGSFTGPRSWTLPDASTTFAGLSITNQTFTTSQTIDRGTGAVPAIIQSSSYLRFYNSDNVNTVLHFDTIGSPAVWLEGRRSGGTRAAPSATGAGENIIVLRAYGYGTALTTNRSASYSILATSLWSGSNQETSHVWEGTPSGSTTVATWMTLSGTSLLVTRAILSSNATGGIGYATGAGGTVTQATSKSTGVTLNTVTGTITMNNASLATVTAVSFTLTNSAIAATDVVAVVIKSGATAGAYTITVDAVAAGSCQISLRNNTLGSLGEAVVLSFAVVKGVAA